MASATSLRRGKHCCVFDCANSYYDKNGHRTSSHFFQFPLEPAKTRNRWCSLIKRQNNKAGFQVTKNTVICDSHFAQDDIKKTLAGRWNLKKGVEPSIFSWSTEKKNRPSPKKRVPTLPKLPKRSVASSESSSPVDVGVQTESNICVVQEESLNSLHKELIEKQRRIDELAQQIKDLQDEVEEFKKSQFSLEKIKNDDEAMLFYTGFPNHSTLISFYEYLEPKLKKMRYWTGEKQHQEEFCYQRETVKDKPGPKRKLSHLTEFFIVLLRLKAGLFVQDLSDRFHVSVGLISKITITWLCLLRKELPLIFPFPSQERVQRNIPEEFCEFPTTRIILDCTEIYIQRPSSMLTQSQTWSDYKHHNTLKALVGISPNGQVTYISDLWGGRASDKLIVKESGVLNLVEQGDNVMVDRGFEIDDIVPLGVRVNMPPFLGSREQMTAEETEKTMKIASVRIHVERAIGRIKNYHILDGSLPLSLTPYANQIFFVCSFLTNFLPPLLKKNVQS